MAALLVTAAGGAAAEDYPTRPITLVVPYSPSTGIDIVARLIGPKISERWGHPVVIDNRPGNSGNIGAYVVSSAKPDGYTLMVTVITFAMTPALTKQLPYDPIADFTPIAEVATGAMALAVNPDKLPVKSVAELIAYAKQHPGQLNYASPGNGTPQHLGVELLKQRLGVDIVHVPYKGTAGAMTDLIGGQVEIAYLPVHVALPHAQSGKLRILAVAGSQRSVLAPDAPSFKELGYDNMDIELWYGIFGPAKLPPEIADKWQRELPAIMALPDVKDQLMRQGMVPMYAPAPELGALMKTDVARWRTVVEKAGIQPD
ncbi:MAG: tripartite tricarboxylate transporter substrate binding protein [Alphaproteobacteria bacterium]|nr:tripartite tricarboxylate transporter substrate binding protein [Alphaproteobacteria bacterium]